MHAYAFFALVTIAIGGIAWVFVYPILSGERAAERRKASVTGSEPVAVRSTRAAQRSRREQVEGTLKEIEERQKKAKRVPLVVRISQAGLSWSKRRFMLTVAALGVGAFVLTLPTGAGLLPAIGIGFGCHCGCSPSSRRGEKRGFSMVFPTPSTSSFAASGPAFAAARQFESDRRQSARADTQRVPYHR